MRWMIAGVLCLVLGGCVGSPYRVGGVEVTKTQWNYAHRESYIVTHKSDPIRISAAILVGRVEIGMNKDQVQAALNIEPYGSGSWEFTHRSTDAQGTFEAWGMGYRYSSGGYYFIGYQHTFYFLNDRLVRVVE